MAPLKSSCSTFSKFVQKFFDRVKKWAPGYVEDVVVVIDGSESINNKCEFEKGKEALRGLMSLALSPDTRWQVTKYAAVTFSCAASGLIKNTDDPIKGGCLIKNGVVFSYMLSVPAYCPYIN